MTGQHGQAYPTELWMRFLTCHPELIDRYVDESWWGASKLLFICPICGYQQRIYQAPAPVPTCPTCNRRS